LGVFVSYIRAFASLQQADSSHVNIQFDRPSVEKFVHAFYKMAARKSWSAAYLFKTIGVSSEQQARNRRDIETMLEGVMNEVIDSFIPWRDISKAYFQAKEEAAKTPVPVVQPKPVTKFEETPKVHEFETDDEESEDEEEIPPVKLGEEITLSTEDIEGDADSVDTDTELEQKMSETVSLNL
jgi:hypothetical protein